MFLLKSWTFWFNVALLLFGTFGPMPDSAKFVVISGAAANIFLRLKTQMQKEDKNETIQSTDKI